MRAQDIIKKTIESRSITITQLASESGLRYETISRFLNGKQSLSEDSLLRLGAALGVDEDDLKGERAFKPQHGSIYGFLDVRGKIERISGVKDLERLYKQICVDEVALQREERELVAEAKKRVKETKNVIAPPVNVEDLFKYEEYDTMKVLVHPFRTSDDEVDDEPNNLGNMCVGYPFEMNGNTWLCSESAYIAGLFSENTPKHLKVQNDLLKEGNGYQAKKVIRQRNMVIAREDWETFNVQWMLYVVWNKCLGNREFANMLMRVPASAIIVENSSLQKGASAAFWGCQNAEWKHAKEVVERCVEIRSSNDIKRKKMLARQQINQIGIYKGVNAMGKILMICRQALENGVAPAIDYDLLRSMNIYILGERLQY